ncbi:hypothetical protein AB0F07_40465 [Streptomyces fructofermentans]|uniref:hypothetical protein n=1 Tax=Streptomyces fructofermentans TaxID=152141 RepID=UPI00340F36B2
MSETSTTHVEQPGGPVHAGSGTLNYTVNLGLGDQERPGPSPRRIADDQLRLLRQQFVDLDGMGAARRVRDGSSTVILHGSPGCGRTAAALVLLHEVHQDTGIFRELLPGEEEGALTDPGLVGGGDRLLLNLAEADVSQWAQARRDLSALRKAVQEQQAHLVVVMPHDGTLEAHLQPYRADIARPPVLEVFRRHLRLHQMPHEEYLRSAPALDAFLAEEPPMEEVAHFADRVRRARAADSASDGFATWCEQSRDARKQWKREVARLVAARCVAPQRALLFATAMLHGAHADVIHHAAALLLRTLGTPHDETPLLEGKDLSERLSEIGAAAGPDGRVRFDKLDYDAAVRAHFWDHMPDLRTLFSTWTVHSTELDDPHLTWDLRRRLVSRLAGQYLRTGRASGDLALLAEEWSAAPASRARLEAAVDVLACGLNDLRCGRELRMLVYDWCIGKRLTGNLAHVLLRVCTDVIAPTHPDQAMTRLHRLARRERGATPALDALCHLAATSARLRRRMLERLTRQSAAPSVDARLFLRLCDPVALTDSGSAPHPLVDDKGVQDCVVTGWAAALTRLPQSHWQPYAERWLHTASASDHHHDQLLALLVDAAGRNGSALAALYSAARAAEPTAPGGRACGATTTERLLQRISTAQGLRPPAAPTPPAPPRGTIR